MSGSGPPTVTATRRLRAAGRGLMFASLLASALAAPAPASALALMRVMTLNLYLGADLGRAIGADTPEAFEQAVRELLDEALRNDFRSRAGAMADSIARTRPDVIGLQEVLDIERDGENSAPPFVDHLTELLDALAARGQSYVVAAVVTNLDAELMIDLSGEGDVALLGLRDRDVILVREGIPFEPLGGSYTEGGLCGFPAPNPNLVPIFGAIFASTPSDDGCSYSAFGDLPTPLGPITVRRGFVGVDATIGGRVVRVVDTHLEVQFPIPDAIGAILQSAQAYELAMTLHGTTPAGRPIVLLGDFNSADADVEVEPFVTPYRRLVGMGFRDSWWLNLVWFLDPLGPTCCQRGDLGNEVSSLTTRIDQIWLRDPGFSIVNLVFVTAHQRLAGPPNWPSDHAGLGAWLLLF